MCKESKKDSSDAGANVASSSLHHANLFNGEENQPTPPTSSSCCGGGPKAQSGGELGVWESSLEDRSSVFSQWMLSYLTPLLHLGSTKVLDADDIGVPSEQDRAERAFDVAKEAWEVQTAAAEAENVVIQEKHQAALDACNSDEERAKVPAPKLKEPSIAMALVRGFGVSKVLVAVLYYVISALLAFVPVLILESLVKFFESGQSVKDVDTWYQNPWVQVVALGILPLTISLLQTRHSTVMAHCAVFVRTAVSTMLFRKSLYVSASGRAMTSTGQVVNMMSNDTAQLQRFLQFVGMTLVAPIQIVVALVLIYGQVGNATWVGVAFMIILAPVNTVVFSIVSKQRRKVLKFSDLRVKMMNEVLAGIRIIKFCAWERPFGKEVDRLRGAELKALTKLAYTSAIGFSLILMSAPLIQPILVFLTYVSIQDEPLTASTAFTTVALFNVMRFPFAFMPMGLLQYIQSKISLRRLERYLALPELDEYVKNEAPPGALDDDPVAQPGCVTVKGSFGWTDPEGKVIRPIQDEPKKKKAQKKNKDASSSVSASIHSANVSVAGSVATEATTTPAITLQDLDCTIKAGQLVAVVGAVGSGKSSFLSAILGEMEPVNDSAVYLPRSSDDNEEGFVSYCTQTPWVVNDSLRGNVLFGRDFDQDRYDRVLEVCALADDLDVLPAGDMTEIGERGINLSGGQKARVSLARALYARNTKLVLMDDPLSAVDAHVGEHIFSQAIAGTICSGITRILVTHHVHLLSRCDNVIVLKGGRIEHQGTYQDLVSSGVNFAGAVDISKVQSSEVKSDDKQAANVVEDDVKKDVDVSDEKKAALKKSGKELVKDEEREEGSVDGSAYMHYAKAGGLLTAAGVFVVQFIGRASEIGSGFWLAYWAERSFAATASGTSHSQSTTNEFLGVYALFGMIGVLGLTGRSLLIAVHRLRASRKLHDNLTESILRAPVAFFDVTPTGRILNRFAADMDRVDLELTQTLSQGVSTIFSVLGAFGAIVAATKGTFLVPMVPLSIIYYMIQKWFRKTSTELQRINSIANSPIFADFSQTLSGTSTIRAYGEERRFFSQCRKSFDTMNSSYILIQLVNYWLGLRLDLLGGMVGAFIGGVAVATSSYNFIPAGWLGLALSYSIEVTNYLKHGVKMMASVEAQMNSVERILFYTEKVEPEAPETIPETDPPAGTWPSQGEIELSNVSMRYRDGPLVLKNLSVKVKAGERIGVCGRTGSGKSSLMISLFRIAEIEEGVISIDGVNTKTIGTAALRLNLSIIPQDPVIFSNSVRYNVDPFETATDDEVWETLQKVQMAETIANLPAGLNEQVAEGGENFSQGQRQLICIARSLIRKPKILVMDEATASMDNETDRLIQEMIRENFQSTTVLTIAHRLNTIMDSDRVLVLDGGEVAEYDAPGVLLERQGSLFRAMVEKSREAKSK